MTSLEMRDLYIYLGEKFAGINARFDSVDARFEKIDTRFEGVGARFEAIDTRFDKIDARFDENDLKQNEILNAIGQRNDEQDAIIEDHRRRLVKLERRASA